jgi:hypothetical protein
MGRRRIEVAQGNKRLIVVNRLMNIQCLLADRCMLVIRDVKEEGTELYSRNVDIYSSSLKRKVSCLGEKLLASQEGSRCI